jgi:hypothetical protein
VSAIQIAVLSLVAILTCLLFYPELRMSWYDILLTL